MQTSSLEKGKDNIFVFPTSGNLFYEKKENLLFCNPHLMPIKSITLEKLETMQQEAQKQLQKNRAQTTNTQNS
jgi:BBSome-interacting protein 1